MTGRTSTGWLRDGRAALDRRGWLELAGAFLLLTVLFTLLGVDFVSSILEDPSLSSNAVITGGAIGTGIAIVLTVLLLLTWRQHPGRVGQRLGRRAWREGRLPVAEPARRLAVADLQRRAEAGTDGPASLILAAFLILIGVLQIAGTDSTFHTTAWLLALALLTFITVRALLDRRRQPQLRALLEQVESHHDR